MNQSIDDTIQCKFCGEVNAIGNSLCSNCHQPLTAYAGEIQGASQEARVQRVQEVETLTRRPPEVIGGVVFQVLFAIFWPLAYAIGLFAQRVQVNEEGTNHIAAAVSVVGPLLGTILLVPCAILLLASAWGAWSQQRWGWTASMATFSVFALLQLTKIGHAFLLSLFWILVSGSMIFLWMRPEVKRWFGQP